MPLHCRLNSEGGKGEQGFLSFPRWQAMALYSDFSSCKVFLGMGVEGQVGNRIPEFYIRLLEHQNYPVLYGMVKHDLMPQRLF